MVLLAILLLAIVAVCLTIYLGLCSRAVVSSATENVSQVENQDARGLTETEIDTFVPLICAGTISDGNGTSMGGQGFQKSCESLVGYPDSDSLLTYPDPDDPTKNLPFELAFTSILYGHLTDGQADQAYVSYLCSCEDHASNWGGGILFQYEATGWSLIRWYPGEAMDNCLMLAPTGKARMLCLTSFSGQGETDTSLMIETVPSTYYEDDSAYEKTILSAVDDSGTGDPPSACGETTSPDQSIILSINSLAPSESPGFFAEAGIEYIAPEDAKTACDLKQDISEADKTEGTIRFKLDGDALTMVPRYKFAPTN